MADVDRSSAAVVRDVAAVARERQISVTAAGLAYHAFNTLVPLVILLLVAVTAVDSLEYVLDALEAATGLETATGGGALRGAAGGGGRLRAAVIALVILAWSAVRLFQAINSAFSDVYGTRKSASLVGAAVDVALAVVTVAVAVALACVLGVALSVTVDGIGLAVVTPVLLFGLLVVAFVPMYYQFPRPAVSIREVLPGTVFASLSWTVLALAFRLYVVTAESVALFGVAGAVLLLLTWVYLGGFCLLLGAVLNAVLAGRVDPEEEWIPMADVWSRYA